MSNAQAQFRRHVKTINMADDSLSKAVDSLQLNGDANGNSEANKSTDDCERKWGFYLDELYKLALQFYKGNYTSP